MERAPRFGAVNVQGWHDLTFLHWPYPAEAVEALLPPDLRVETAEGRAWVGVTPFAMHAVRPVGLPPLPHLSSFPEVNCRTYVRHANGTRGIWFFSLDTPRLRIIAALRTLGLPYCWARADVAAEPSGATVPRRVAYRGRRLLPRPDGAPAADWRVTVDVGAHLDHPDPTRSPSFSRHAGGRSPGGPAGRGRFPSTTRTGRCGRRAPPSPTSRGCSRRRGCRVPRGSRSSTSRRGYAAAWGSPGRPERRPRSHHQVPSPRHPGDEGR